MPVVALFKDPANIAQKEVFYPSTGETIEAFLCREFPHNFNGIETDIYLNDSITPIVSTASGDFEGVNHVMQSDDRIVIVHRPSGIESFFYYVIVLIVAVAASLLLTPNVPGSADDQGSSPNNKLNAATNEFRPDEAIPEVFGSPNLYPDFAQPSHYIYRSNLKVQRELFCVGVGAFDYSNGFVRSSETNLDVIPEATYTIYDPGQLPPEEQRLIVRENNEITNQALEAPNSESITGVYAVPNDTAIISDGTSSIINVGEDILANLALVIGDFVDVSIFENDTTIIFSGQYEITDINYVSSRITVLSNSSVNSAPDSTSEVTVTRLTEDLQVDNFVGYYVVEGSDNEEVWFHIALPQGLRKEGGGEWSVEIEMEIEQIDENGEPVVGGYTDSAIETITDKTLDPQYRTYYFTGLTKGRYQARARRLSDELGGAASEKVQVEQIVGVEYQPNPNYGDVTMIWVERRASERLVGGNRSKVNLVNWVRKLPYFNRETGLLETSNLVATRDFADAAAYTLIVAGKRAQTQVDLAELYAVNDSLPANLRSFDFTFDDEDVALKERIDVICNVARTLAFQNYQKWRFNRIESKPVHTMLFNRRNTVGSANQSIPQWLPSDKDSISLTYVTLPDNVKKTIHRRIAGGAIVNDGTAGLYPNRITLTGCQSDEQAENRIEFEIRQLLYQRNTVEFTADYFGLTATLGDRVRWVDMNDQDVFDGEILYVIGNEFLTSEEIIFEDGVTYYVQITEEDGSVSDLVECQPLDYTTKGFSAVGLNAYTGRDLGTEFGSKYLIAPDDELNGTDYVLKSIRPDSNGRVTVTLSEYNEIIFEQD